MPELMPGVVPVQKFAGTRQPTLVSGDGLVLRPWLPEDARAVFEAYRDPAISRWHVRTATSVDEVGEWIERWRAAWSQAENAQWAVTLGGEVAGRIGLRRMRLPEGATELAYWTMPAWRGRAVSPRAVRSLTRWAFDEIGFVRVVIAHSVLNVPSCRVATKCGFALEGIKAKSGLHGDGWHDMHLHALVRGG